MTGKKSHSIRRICDHHASLHHRWTSNAKAPTSEAYLHALQIEGLQILQALSGGLEHAHDVFYIQMVARPLGTKMQICCQGLSTDVRGVEDCHDSAHNRHQSFNGIKCRAGTCGHTGLQAVDAND